MFTVPSSSRAFLLRIAALLAISVQTLAASAQVITSDSWEQLVPQGKEVDAIFGDAALRNSAAAAVIARPGPLRHANMTVKNVGGCLIDFTVTDRPADQLAAFYPGRRKFPFSQMDASAEYVAVTAEAAASRPRCVTRYTMHPDLPVVHVKTVWENTSSKPLTVSLEDDLRADGGKEDMVRSADGVHTYFFVHDIYWEQAYAIVAPGYSIRCSGNSRESVLKYEQDEKNTVALAPGDSFTLTRHVIAGRDLAAVQSVLRRLDGRDDDRNVTWIFRDADGRPLPRVRVTGESSSESFGTSVADDEGRLLMSLPDGDYRLRVEWQGISLTKPGHPLSASVSASHTEQTFQFEHHTGDLQAVITDAEGRPMPVKVQISGANETPTPSWGPETAVYFVRNLAYTPDGQFSVPLTAGEYDITVSRGPEYDAVFRRVKVDRNETTVLEASLKRSVDTTGWVSGDFHSHSSPSGDNTASQRGRVLNLAAEHIEFAPCTEHNRVDTYDAHIRALKLQPFLATVSGIELTGQPLLLNHQNAFPMIHRFGHQDGGGPQTDPNPEVQIERLALWDNRSEKVIQQNHPDIGWLFFDKDGDGKRDEGYARSFPFIDIMEIHPIDRMLNLQQYEVRDGKPYGNHRMLNWLQLLNQGFRIYGVVNTDAHYNYHGSGWLRNWIRSDSDAPASQNRDALVRTIQSGEFIMSNGPFLDVSINESGREKKVISGQDLTALSRNIDIHIRVQCPNWMDVDTVFVLVNGRVPRELSFTRQESPKMFRSAEKGAVRFEQLVSITLKEDSHIIVVAGHRTQTLEEVQGDAWGRQHPTAITNPVFVDIDGQGFIANKDTLDHQLPVKFKPPAN